MLEIIKETDTYTTDDELEFLFGLADKGKYGALRALKQAYKTRDWSGEGMEVDAKHVNYALDFILERREIVA